jgi:protein gp37
MGDNTGISWCDATANAIVGCTDESEACRNCFARDLSATRLKHLPRYKGLAVITEKGRSQWTGEVRLNEDALEQVMTWRRPRKVFLTTMGDPCHESLSDETMAQFFAVTLAAPQHIHQVLTKRPKRMREFFERVSVADLCDVARGMVSRSKGAVVKGEHHGEG